MTLRHRSRMRRPAPIGGPGCEPLSGAPGRAARIFACAALALAVLCQAPALARTFRIPAPVAIKVKIDRALESTKEAASTEFLVTVAAPLRAEGCFLLKAGATGQGRVVGSFPPQKKGVPGKLQLQLTKLSFADGKSRPVSTKPLEVLGEKPKTEKVMKILWSKKGGKATVEPGQELSFEIDADVDLEMECVKQ
jgi:hypothetical protein